MASKLTEVARLLMLANYADSANTDLAQVLGVNVATIYKWANTLGLKKSDAYTAEQGNKLAAAGAAHQFKPGIRPWNIGLHVVAGGRSAETRFVKGQRPHNDVPVGSYRVNKYYGGKNKAIGALELKFSDEPGPYTKRWIPVHRKVWIEANGPVPANHVVAFKDGQHTTTLEEITLDRLELVSRGDMVRRHGIAALPKELADLHRTRGVLTRAINKARKPTQQGD